MNACAREMGKCSTWSDKSMRMNPRVTKHIKCASAVLIDMIHLELPIFNYLI